MIPLKARAWVDLTNRRARGENIQSDQIKKHRSDVVRLSELLAPSERVELPEQIAVDLATFLKSAFVGGYNPGDVGVLRTTIDEVELTLRTVFRATNRVVQLRPILLWVDAISHM